MLSWKKNNFQINMDAKCQVGNHWTGLFLAYSDRTEYSVKKIETKTRKTADKAILFFQISQNFLKIFKYCEKFLNISQNQDICVPYWAYWARGRVPVPNARSGFSFFLQKQHSSNRSQILWLVLILLREHFCISIVWSRNLTRVLK